MDNGSIGLCYRSYRKSFAWAQAMGDNEKSETIATGRFDLGRCEASLLSQC